MQVCQLQPVEACHAYMVQNMIYISIASELFIGLNVGSLTAQPACFSSLVAS